jgi:hypothetical protein
VCRLSQCEDRRWHLKLCLLSVCVRTRKYRMFIVRAYQTSQYVVPRGGIFLGKWLSSFAGNSDGKMNVLSACALNTRYKLFYVTAVPSSAPGCRIECALSLHFLIHLSTSVVTCVCRPDRFWCSPRLLFNVYRGPFPRG